MKRRHEITAEELKSFEPMALVASGNASGGKLKRLWVKTILQPETKAVFVIETVNQPDKEYATLTEAIEAYNDL